MKTPKRFPPLLVAALLLGGTAVTLAGCAHKEAAPPAPPRPSATVIAVVTFDGKTATMKTSQNLPDKLIQLSLSHQDTVEWVSPDGIVYVDGWSPENPFADEPKHENKVLKSGPPKKKGKFDYRVWLQLTGENDPNKRIKVDPRIEVME